MEKITISNSQFSWTKAFIHNAIEDFIQRQIELPIYEDIIEELQDLYHKLANLDTTFSYEITINS